MSTSSFSTQHRTSSRAVFPTRISRTVLERAPCDVGVLSGTGEMATGPIVTPFGGAEHDWAAIEVAAWLAQSLETTLRLLGTEADPALGRRDASRLLARASLLVQQVVGIVDRARSRPRGRGRCPRSVPRRPPARRRPLRSLANRRHRPHANGRRSGRRGADPLRATWPPARRRRPERVADPLHLDARVRADPTGFSVAVLRPTHRELDNVSGDLPDARSRHHRSNIRVSHSCESRPQPTPFRHSNPRQPRTRNEDPTDVGRRANGLNTRLRSDEPEPGDGPYIPIAW